MEICEEDKAFAEVLILFLDRLFDLHDHLGQSPDVIGGTNDLGSCGLIFVVGHGGKRTSVMFNENLVSRFDQSLHTSWSYAYSALMVLYFLRHTNNHSLSPQQQS